MSAELITRAYAASKLDVVDGERAVIAKINTDEVDRYGTVIEPSGIDLRSYRTNPVVLWEHGQDPARGRVPIGRNACNEIRHVPSVPLFSSMSVPRAESRELRR